MMKKQFWSLAFALVATLCLSFGIVSVAYTANAEETENETTVEETSFELLDENASFDNGNAGLTYDIATKTGKANKTDGTIDNRYFSYPTKEYVTTPDGVRELAGLSAEYSVTFSNVATLAKPDTNFIGVVFTVDGFTIKYRVGSTINFGGYDYLPLGNNEASPFAISTTGNKRNLKTQVLSEGDTSVTIVFKFTPKVGDTNGSYTITVDGVEAVTYEYGSTSLPQMGLQVGKNSADISNASIKILGATGWYVEPETTFDMLSYDKAQNAIVSDGVTEDGKYSYDFANKVGYIGGSADGIGVVEKERAKAYFDVDTPDKVIAKDDTIIDYSAIEKMGFSITYSDIIAVDGTFDAKNNNEFIAIALCSPDADDDWAGLWVMGAQNYNHIGVLERNLKGTGLFANGDTTTTIRFGGVTSPVVDGSATLTIIVTKATDDEAGSIEVLWNGVTATTFSYTGKVFPKVGTYTRGVCAKITNVSYQLYGVKGVHEHTEEILDAIPNTCTTDGLTEGKKCSVCDMILVAQQTIPAAHTTTKTEAVAPTCTEAGNIAYWTCSGVCGKIYADEACTQEVTDTVLPAKGHNTSKTEAKAATCTEDGWIDFWFCNDCSKIYSDEECTTEITAEDAIIPALGHTESDWIIDTEAQIGVAGSKHKECTVCGETLATEEIPALEETTSEEIESSESTGETPNESVGESAVEGDSTESASNSGCMGMVDGLSIGLVMLGVSAVAILRKKKED